MKVFLFPASTKADEINRTIAGIGEIGLGPETDDDQDLETEDEGLGLIRGIGGTEGRLFRSF